MKVRADIDQSHLELVAKGGFGTRYVNGFVVDIEAFESNKLVWIHIYATAFAWQLQEGFYEFQLTIS